MYVQVSVIKMLFLYLICKHTSAGLILCLGHPVDAALMKFVRGEVHSLVKDAETVRKTNEDEAKRIKDALQNVKDEINKFDDRMSTLERKVETLEKSQGEIGSDVENLATIGKTLAADLQEEKERGLETRSRVSAVEHTQQTLCTSLHSLQDKQLETNERVNVIEYNQERMEERMKVLESHNKKSQKIFKFQAPVRNPYFCGRSKELDTLRAQALAKPTLSGCVTSVVCGLGGTGKTSLAVEYVWQLKKEFTGGIFWISGESTSLFQITLSDMACQIGTLESEFSQTLSKTLHWLQSSDDRWCVVLDNLDERELSREMIQFIQGHWKREAHGHLVVTTRREPREVTDVGIEEESCIELKSFGSEEGIQFIKIRTGKNNEGEDTSVAEIVQELGGLPLALEQAAAYVKFLCCSFAKYLQQYRDQKLGLLNRRKARHPAEHTSPDRLAVLTTWSLNFEYISKMSEEYNLGQAASTVMEISAFLSPDDIPCEVINEGFPVVEIQELKDSAKSDLGPIEILSLLTKFSLFQQNSPSSYSVHRLVQEVIRARIEKDRAPFVLQSATRMLRYSFEHTQSPTNVCSSFVGDAVFSVDNLPSLHLWGRLAAHACVLYDHLLDFDKTNRGVFRPVLFSEETAKLLNEAAIYLSICREKVKALELSKRKLEILMHTQSSETDKTNEIVKSLDIPLKDMEFKLISRCMKEEEIDVSEEKQELDLSNVSERSEELRARGNQAVGEKKYDDALIIYSSREFYSKRSPSLRKPWSLSFEAGTSQVGSGELRKVFETKSFKLQSVSKESLGTARSRKRWSSRTRGSRTCCSCSCCACEPE